MKIRYSIAWKIGTGFSILLLLTIIVFYNTNVVLNSSKQISDDINEIYNPSVYELEVLKLHLLESNTLITEWVNNQSSEDKEFKMTYINLVQNEIPRSKERIKELYKHWIDAEKHSAEQIFAEIDSLLKVHFQIRNNLQTWEDYEDPQAKFLSNYALEGAVMQLNEIDIIIQELIIKEKNNTIKISKDMVQSFETLQFIVRYLGIALVLMGIIISIYTARSIVKPVNYAKR